MKKEFKIIKKAAAAVLAISLLMSPVSCEVNTDQNLFSVVTMNLSLSGGEKISSMRVDMSQNGNYFQDLNTQQTYEFPSFTGGQGTLRVLKGLYIFAFDASAQLEGGEWVKVRCAGHSSPADAVTLIDDAVTLEIELMKL